MSMAHELQLSGHHLLEFNSRMGSFLHKIPLVDYEDQSAASFPGIAADMCILLGNSLDRIDEQEADVGSLQLTSRHNDGEDLRALFGLSLPPDSRSIDKSVPETVLSQDCIDRVSRCSRNIAHEYPLVSDQAVEQ